MEEARRVARVVRLRETRGASAWRGARERSARWPGPGKEAGLGGGARSVPCFAGYTVLRLEAEMVMRDLPSALARIRAALSQR